MGSRTSARRVSLALLGAVVLGTLGVLAVRPTSAASALTATSPVLSADSSPSAIAAQYLLEISESKSKPILVACATIPDKLTPGYVFLGGAVLKGNVMLLSTKYVCQPLAYAYRRSPIFTGHSQPTLPFSSVDAVEIVANEWFNTQGVADIRRSICHAVEYTWKWLRRSDLSPAFMVAARRHLLDNGLRPEGYAVAPGCLTAG
jgi:hypothetical protein